jgi:hypothetical protein
MVATTDSLRGPSTVGDMFTLGLDGEMSDSDLDKGAKLIQIGLWHPDAGAFCADIGWDRTTFDETVPQADDLAFCTTKALTVNQFTPERIEEAPPAWHVDDQLYDWLVAAGAKTDRRGVESVGFNVGAFDLPFVRAHLPKSSTIISRRSIDLNAVIATMEGEVTYNGNKPARSGWKRLGKRAGRLLCAEQEVAGVEHDAGYDAALAYGAWQFYRQAIGGRAPFLD